MKIFTKILLTLAVIFTFSQIPSTVSANSGNNSERFFRDKGIVVWFNNNKGYGYIAVESQGLDVFFHHAALISEDDRTVKAGDIVELDIMAGRKGRQAKNVQIIKMGTKDRNGKGIEDEDSRLFGKITEIGPDSYQIYDYSSMSFLYSSENISKFKVGDRVSYMRTAVGRVGSVHKIEIKGK